MVQGSFSALSPDGGPAQTQTASERRLVRQQRRDVCLLRLRELTASHSV